MSTKIYNGYRLEGATTLADVMKFHRLAREKLLPLVQEATGQGHVVAAALLVSRIIEGRQAQDEGSKFELNAQLSFGFQVELFYKHLQKQPERSYSMFDPNVRIGYGWSANGQILMMFYAHLKRMDEAWESIPGVKEYGYWNNTDPLEGVSDEEWAIRCEEWESVLPGYDPPSQSLLWQEIDAEYGIFSWHDDCAKSIKGFTREMLSWKPGEIKEYYDKRKKE